MKGYASMNEWFSAYKKTFISTAIVVATILLGILLVYGFLSGSIGAFLNDFFEIISPIVIGFIIAYLSNPIVSFFERHLLFWIKHAKLKRFFSILLAFALIILFLAFLITMLIPNIIDTLQSFWDTYIVHYDVSIRALANRINLLMDDFEVLDTVQRLDPDGLLLWIKERFPWIESIANGDISDILPGESDILAPDKIKDTSIDSENGIFTTENLWLLLGYAFTFGTSVFNFVKNFVLGIFISFYMLMAKDKWKALIRRFLNVFLSPKHVRSVIRFGKLLDRSFGGFIEGQLLDAIIIGIVSFIVFNIFGIPIPHLLATIIAVTNVIPIFGPFIGGIPAAFIVLLTQPEKTLLFILLIIVMQQIDGNIICPHIIGDKINISSLTTIIAIITMGGLFGIFGMLIGVPVFAVAVNVIQNHTLNTLRRKGYETSLDHYYVGKSENISDPKVDPNNIFVKAYSALTKAFSKIGELIKNLFTKNKEK